MAGGSGSNLVLEPSSYRRHASHRCAALPASHPPTRISTAPPAVATAIADGPHPSTINFSRALLDWTSFLASAWPLYSVPLAYVPPWRRRRSPLWRMTSFIHCLARKQARYACFFLRRRTAFYSLPLPGRYGVSRATPPSTPRTRALCHLPHLRFLLQRWAFVHAAHYQFISRRDSVLLLVMLGNMAAAWHAT